MIPAFPDALHLVAFVALFLVLGVAIGAVGGLFGIGGGVIAIPMLTLVFGFDQIVAQGTTLVMVVPNVMSGLRGYARRGELDRGAALMLAAGAVPCAFVGALWAVRSSGAGLQLAFAIFLGALGLYTAVRAARGNLEPIGRPFARGTLWIVGVCGGVLNGLFGVGGAVFAVPVTTLLYGYRQIEAQGLSLALVGPTLVVGLITYGIAGKVVWWFGIPLAIGGIAGVPLGVDLAHRTSERRLRLGFAIMLLATAGALALHR